MDGAKKTTKNTFSVPSAKKKELHDPVDSTSPLKVKDKMKKTKKENKPEFNQTKTQGKSAVSKLPKEKKLASRNDHTSKTDDKEKKQASNRSQQRAAKNTRSLTDAEYEDIFKAVICIDRSVHAEENKGENQALCGDVYTVLTQEDSQNESEMKETDDSAVAKSSKDEGSSSMVDNAPDDKHQQHPHNTLSGQVKPSGDKDQANDSIDGQILKNDIKRDENSDQSETVKSKGNRNDTGGKKAKTGKKYKGKVKEESDIKKETDSKEADDAAGDNSKKGREKKNGRETDADSSKRRKTREEDVSKNTEAKEQLCEKPDAGGENKESHSEGEKMENEKLNRGRKRKGRTKVETASEGEEKDDDVSVVSEQSISSSLLDMAVEVDQWDRPEDIQQNNEHTPHASDTETGPHAGTVTIAQKPKKVKHRKNQLAPRKLCFDVPALQNPAPKTKELSKKKVQSRQKSAASVAEFEKKEKSFRLAVKQEMKSQKQKEEESSQKEIPAELGTWVQCCKSSCKKWRYLPDVHDPAQVDDLWVCSMHPDTLYNSCDKAEQHYDESDHIFTKFTLGSVVWAKVDGFPWWPAIVDTDPDYDVYCEIPSEDSMVPTEYHVVFLDENVTRTWVRKNRIKQLMLSQLAMGSSYLKGHKYKREVSVAMRKAELALNMSLKERLDKFGFAACFKNMNTRWTKAPVKKKQPKHRKGQKRVYEGVEKPPSAKKVKHAADTSDDDSDSDTSSPNTGYAPDNDLSSQSSSEHDATAGHSEYLHESKKATKKRMAVSSVARQQVRRKLKVRDGVSDRLKETKVTKKSEVGETGLKRKMISKKDHGNLKAKKLKFKAPLSAGRVEDSDSNEEILLREKSAPESDEEVSFKNISALQNDDEISFKSNAGLHSDEEISLKNTTDLQNDDKISFKKNSGLRSDEELVIRHEHSRSELEADSTEVTDTTEVEDPTEVENSTEQFSSRNSSDNSDEEQYAKVPKLKKKPCRSDRKIKSKSSNEAHSKKIGKAIVHNSEDVKIPEGALLLKDVKLNKEVSEVKKKKKTTESKTVAGKDSPGPPSQTRTGKKNKKLIKSENLRNQEVDKKGDQEEAKKEKKPESTGPDKEKMLTEMEKQEKRGSVKRPKAPKKEKATDTSAAGTKQSSKKKPKLDGDGEKKTLSHKPSETKSDSSDKKPRAKPQKFITPAKLKSQTSAPKTKPSLCSTNTSFLAKDKQKTEEMSEKSKPPMLQEGCSSSQTKKQKKTVYNPVSTQDTVKDNPLAVDSDENDSPLLSPQNKDQFVPSMDNESDNLDVVSDDNNITAKEAWEKNKVMEAVKGFEEGDSDSICLDIDEDVPIPCLQQVLSVEGKGCSDQEGDGSDPLEMAED